MIPSLPSILAILLALSVHEAAHAFVADALGDPTAKYEGRLTLNPIAHLDPIGTLLFLLVGFGWGKPVPVNPRYLHSPKRDAALVSLAGPASNLLLGTASFLLLRLLSPRGISLATLSGGNLLTAFLAASLFLNLGLMAFNLLPIAPLDGSKVLGAFVPLRLEDRYDALMRYGPYLLLLLLIAERTMGVSILFAWINGISDGVLRLLTTILG